MSKGRKGKDMLEIGKIKKWDKDEKRERKG